MAPLRASDVSPRHLHYQAHSSRLLPLQAATPPELKTEEQDAEDAQHAAHLQDGAAASTSAPAGAAGAEAAATAGAAAAAAAAAGAAEGAPRIPARPVILPSVLKAQRQPTADLPPSSSAEPLPAASLKSLDADALPEGFKGRRLLCFLGIVAAYMGLYFTRGTLTYSAPALVADPAMGITLKDVGSMTTAFPLAYGISKFVGGVAGAKFSPTLMLGGGLALTALINIAAAAPGVGVAALTTLWALNGCLQGIGAPASAALLTRWFASKERGTYWGIWNVGANVGGFLTPLVVGNAAKVWGWRYGFAIPGVAALLVALFSLKVVKDSPSQAGYSTAEEEAAIISKAPAPKADIGKALLQVLANKGCWLLALAYFFVYVVRQGATSWLVFYLMAAKGSPDAAAAAQTVSGLELGGLVGGSLAGYLSDLRVKSAQGSGTGHVGRRVQIILAYVVATFGVLAMLRAVPAGSQMLLWLSIAALGFCIYGPQMLIGLCGAELVDKPAVGASQGLLGLIAYIGAANAGIPLSHIVATYGWDGYFVALAASAACALCLLVPLANAKSQLQLKTEAALAR